MSFLPLGTFSSPNQKPNFTGPAEPEMGSVGLWPAAHSSPRFHAALKEEACRGPMTEVCPPGGI